MVSTLRKTMMYLGLVEPIEDEDSQNKQLKHYTNSKHNFNDSKQNPCKKQEIGDKRHFKNSSREYYRDSKKFNDIDNKEENDDNYQSLSTNSNELVEENLKQINTFHPQSYNDAKTIGESFRSGIPIIMNVTDMSESDAKRLVDFSAGLAFGLYGAIEKVTSKVFLLSPSYIEILGDERGKNKSSGNFFNNQM